MPNDTTVTTPAPTNGAPPPVAPPRVNETEKQLRETKLALQRMQTEAQQRDQQLKEREARIAKQEQEAKSLMDSATRAREIGPKDLADMFKRLNIPADEQLKRLSAYQMQLMTKGQIDPSADAPVNHVNERIDQLERQLREQADLHSRTQQEAQAQQQEFAQKQWYAELQRQASMDPNCKLTRIPHIGMQMLDEDLQRYQQETSLSYQPVFGERAKAVEARLAADLATAGYYRLDGTTLYDADGAVKGTLTLPASEGAPAEGDAAPSGEIVPPSEAKPTSDAAPPPMDPRRKAAVVHGIGQPGVRLPPPPSVRSLDTAMGATPGAPAPFVFGNIKRRDDATPGSQYAEILKRQQANAAGGKPPGT